MGSDLTKFLLERELSYRRLEDLLGRAETRGFKGFRREELRELGHNYRLAASDLARARYVLRSPLLSEYLNELVGRAHHVIHRKRTSFFQGFIRFIARDFPAAVRKEAKLIYLAAALMMGMSVIGGMAYQANHDWGQLAFNQAGLRDYESSQEDGPSRLAAAIDEEMMADASGYIIFNNVRISIVACAGGVLFGLGTAMALMYNGFFLGIIGSMYLSRGYDHALYFWSGILPHGVLEIPAIIIAGAAGFLLARGLLIPGKLSRGDALRREGKNSMLLLGGVILTLIIAGFIEGFITPLKLGVLGMYAKLMFSFLAFAAFLLYLFFSGREFDGLESEEKLRTTTHLRID